MFQLPRRGRAYHLPKFEGIGSLTLCEDEIHALKTTEVLVKVYAVSLNRRDLSVATGGSFSQPPENVIPCSDMAGEIIALGPDVRGWKIGERVCANFLVDFTHGDLTPAARATGLSGSTDGVLAEYKNFPAHALVRIPEYLTYEEASTLPCAALTAYNALFGPMPLKGGDTVLVQGSGGVSSFALQFALASGATVIATSSSDEKLNLAKENGARYLINYNTTPKWNEEVMKITNGRGVDRIVEVGGSGTMARSLRAIRLAGVISAVGFVSKDKEDTNVIASSVMRAVTIRGIFLGSVKQFEDMNRLLAARQIRPIVNQVFAFEDAAEAYRHLQSQSHVGKVVIRVAGRSDQGA